MRYFTRNLKINLQLVKCQQLLDGFPLTLVLRVLERCHTQLHAIVWLKTVSSDSSTRNRSLKLCNFPNSGQLTHSLSSKLRLSNLRHKHGGSADSLANKCSFQFNHFHIQNHISHRLQIQINNCSSNPGAKMVFFFVESSSDFSAHGWGIVFPKSQRGS